MILNSLGFFILYLSEIRNCEIESRKFIASESVLAEKMLTVFTTGKNNFQVINSDEIISNGKLFDIVKTGFRNGKKIFYTIGDELEDNVVSKILLITAANADNQSTPEAKFFPELLKNLYDCPNVNSFYNYSSTIEIKYPFSKSLFIQTIYLELISPPPENFS